MKDRSDGVIRPDILKGDSVGSWNDVSDIDALNIGKVSQ